MQEPHLLRDSEGAARRRDDIRTNRHRLDYMHIGRMNVDGLLSDREGQTAMTDSVGAIRHRRNSSTAAPVRGYPFMPPAVLVEAKSVGPLGSFVDSCACPRGLPFTLGSRCSTG